tara:strand:- start:57 stop:287 length:231 start_codon:yes stop_codon:yes gene_type:complete
MITRCIAIGFTAKDGVREFASVKGYKMTEGEAIPSYVDIRKHCLEWSNRDGDQFEYCQINFMQFLDEVDYDSLMGI